MNTLFRHSLLALSVGGLLSVAGCSGMTQQEKNTGYGAAAGGAAGALITGGGALGTLGGAAVGGLIGHEVSKDKDKKKD